MLTAKGLSAEFVRNVSIATGLFALILLALNAATGGVMGKTAVIAIISIALTALAAIAIMALLRTAPPRPGSDRGGRIDERLAFLLDNAGCAAAICDSKGGVIVTNAEWLGHPLLGQALSHQAGQDGRLDGVFTGKSRERVRRALEDAAANLPHQRFIVSQYLPPNHYTLGVSIDRADFSRDEVLIRIQDESKYTDALGLLSEQSIALLDAETRFKLLVEQAWDAVVLVDADTLAVEECNPAFEMLTSKPCSRIVGRSILSFFPPESVEKAGELFFPAQHKDAYGPADLEITSDGSQKSMAACQSIQISLGDKPYFIFLARDITDRYHLEGGMIERNVLLSHLVRIGRTLNEDLDISIIVEKLGASLGQIVNFNRISLLLYDDQLNELSFHDSEPASSRKFPPNKSIPAEKNIVWESFSRGLPYQLFAGAIEDSVLASLGIPAEAKHEIASVLAINLVFKGESQGLLVFESAKPDVFDTPTVSFLLQLGSQLATVVLNARLLDYQRKRTEQFALINKLATKVLETLNIETILQEAGSSIIEHFGYDNVFLFLAEEESGDLYLFSSVGADASGIRQGIRIPSGVGLVGLAADSGKVQISRDCAKDERFLNPFSDNVVRSELAIPIMKGKHVLGVMDVENRRRNSFSDNDIAVLETITGQLANALSNAYNYENLKEHAEQLETYRQRITGDLELASSIMKNLLPRDFAHPKVELSYVYDPHAGIGGDFVKVDTRGDWVYILVGDLSGHGIGAAIVMVGVASEIENVIAEGLSPSEIAARLNNFVLRNFGFLGIYLSLFCARLNTKDGTLEHLNAGHTPAVIHLPSERPVTLPSTNSPLGLFGDDFAASIGDARIVLPPKARMVVYTDGLLDDRGGTYTEADLISDVSKFANSRICDLAMKLAERSSLGVSRDDRSDDRLVAAVEFRSGTDVFERFSTLIDIDRVVEKLIKFCKAYGYADDETMFLRLGNYEMMVNCVKHGHCYNPSKAAEIEGVISDSGWKFTLRDHGSGFEFHEMTVPVSEEEFILKTSGRGINLTQRIVDNMEYSDRGRAVTLTRKIRRT